MITQFIVQTYQKKIRVIYDSAKRKEKNVPIFFFKTQQKSNNNKILKS